MKPPVSLFKKKSRKLCLFLKAKSQNLINTVPSKHSSWWRRLSSSSSEDVFKTSWSRRIYSPYSYVFRRRLQDVLIKTNIFVLVIRLQDVFKTFSRSLQEVFKTCSRRLVKTFSRLLQNLFKTSSRHFEDVFKHLQDVFKIFSRRIIKLICSW